MAIDEHSPEMEACSCKFKMDLSQEEALLIRDIRSANFARAEEAYSRMKARRVEEDHCTAQGEAKLSE